MLCCPSCTIQYLDSARAPAHIHEQEFRKYENGLHLLIAEDKPWP